MGSTNYGKLTNVSIVPAASAQAVTGANGNGAPDSGQDYVQTFSFVLTAVNNEHRCSDGASRSLVYTQ
jgi:hypothetical protein